MPMCNAASSGGFFNPGGLVASSTDLVSTQTTGDSVAFAERLSDSLNQSLTTPEAGRAAVELEAEPGDARSVGAAEEPALLLAMMTALLEGRPVTHPLELNSSREASTTPNTGMAVVEHEAESEDAKPANARSELRRLPATLTATLDGRPVVQPSLTSSNGKANITRDAGPRVNEHGVELEYAPPAVAMGELPRLRVMPPALLDGRPVMTPSELNLIGEASVPGDERVVHGDDEPAAGSVSPSMNRSLPGGDVIAPPVSLTETPRPNGSSGATPGQAEVGAEDLLSVGDSSRDAYPALVDRPELQRGGGTSLESDALTIEREGPWQALDVRLPAPAILSEPEAGRPVSSKGAPAATRAAGPFSAEAEPPRSPARATELPQPEDEPNDRSEKIELIAEADRGFRKPAASPRVERVSNGSLMIARGVHAYEGLSAVGRRPLEAIPAGTASARLEGSMETVVEEPQFAGLPEQKLPVSGRMLPGSDAKGALLPVVEVTHEALGNQTGRSGNGRGESGHLAASPISVADSFSGPLVAATEASPVTRTMENLASSLSREVAQFKRFNAESMAVVLKPDAQTEIFLHLVSRQGQVEMQARFERGDFQAVNGQWSQLQQSLSLHGVRLGALQEGFNQPSGNPSSAGAEWGHGQLPGQHRQPSGQGGRGESTLEFSQEADRLSEQPRFAKPSAPVRRNVRRVTLEAWA